MSIVEGGQARRTYTADAAIAAGLAVAQGAAEGGAKLPAVAGDNCLGLAYLKGDPADLKYRQFTVVTQGEATGVAGGTIAAGQYLSALATGKLVAWTSGAIVGKALDDAVLDEELAVLVENKPKRDLKMAVIAGGAAGAHTVTGIAVGDKIVSVEHFSTAAAIATLGDLTAEFSVTAANEVTNTTTDTTSDALVVRYEDRT